MRVKRHVELIVQDSDSLAETLHEPGWEGPSLLALRRRIDDLQAE
jgi:hypothetical protein